MNYLDEEFEDTLKNIFAHQIVGGTFRDKESYLGVSQGGINACSIVKIEYVGTECFRETWELAYDHPDPNYKIGHVVILLDERDACLGIPCATVKYSDGTTRKVMSLKS